MRRPAHLGVNWSRKPGGPGSSSAHLSKMEKYSSAPVQAASSCGTRGKSSSMGGAMARREAVHPTHAPHKRTPCPARSIPCGAQMGRKDHSELSQDSADASQVYSTRALHS